VQERERFIETYLTGLYSVSELAERFGVSRQKLHKWLVRHNADGMKGLVDRSRAPHHIPHRTSSEVEEKIVAFRRRFPHMGPRKVIARLAELHPDTDWPSPSTAGDILCRANLVRPRERRSPPAHPLRVRSQPIEPNDLMTVDYKGQFLMGNHRYCYPLTVVDHVSRYLLACDAFPSNEGAHTQRAFERIFREYGLPRADPLGQRQPVRISWSGKTFPPFAIVDSLGHCHRAYRSGSPPGERCTRAHAPHAQSRNRETAGTGYEAPAEAIRRVPAYLQP
jgi:transposase-like protein